MRMMAGVAPCVRTMKGSKVVLPAAVLIVVLAAFVPHQLLVAAMVLLMFSRLLPETPAVLPASRLKLMVKFPPPDTVPEEMPPPRPFEALLPVMVTLVSVTESVHAPGQPLAEGFMKIPPPSVLFRTFALPALLLLMMLPWSTSRFARVLMPPPSPAAWLPEMVLE